MAEETPPSGTRLGRLEPMIENMSDQLRVVAEYMFGIEDRILARLEPRFARIEQRLDALEAAVIDLSRWTREHSQVLGEHTLAMRELQRTTREHSQVLGEHTLAVRELQKTTREHSQVLGEHTLGVRELEETTRGNTQEVRIMRGDLHAHTREIAELRAELRRAREARDDSKRIDELERRVADLEARVGIEPE